MFCDQFCFRVDFELTRDFRVEISCGRFCVYNRRKQVRTEEVDLGAMSDYIFQRQPPYLPSHMLFLQWDLPARGGGLYSFPGNLSRCVITDEVTLEARHKRQHVFHLAPLGHLLWEVSRHTVRGPSSPVERPWGGVLAIAGEAQPIARRVSEQVLSDRTLSPSSLRRFLAEASTFFLHPFRIP